LIKDIDTLKDNINFISKDAIRGLDRGISVACKLSGVILDDIKDGPTQLYYYHYRRMNHLLDNIALLLCACIEKRGYRALPVAASQTIDKERHHGLFSHKLAAHRAGLGWIGKSCLLVTPQVGPRVRWVTVLTDAPLETGQPMSERCGSCTECVDGCPAHAFTGRRFREDEPREARFDVHKCYAYQRREREHLDSILCGVCLYVCPHGRKE